MFKKLIVLILVGISLFAFVPAVWGDEDTPSYRGELTGLAGNMSMGKLDYRLGERFNAEAFSEDGVTNLGVNFQPADWIGLKAGATYDTKVAEDAQTVPYGGMNFNLPFGTNNLRISGSYDYNYAAKDWSRYEAALRIQMYQHIFLYAGVRGDAGVHAPEYSYNLEKEALLFLRGEVELTKGKWEVDLDPLLYLNGTLVSDYSVKYQLNDRLSLMANVNTLNITNDFVYRAGVQFKF